MATAELCEMRGRTLCHRSRYPRRCQYDGCRCRPCREAEAAYHARYAKRLVPAWWMRAPCGRVSSGRAVLALCEANDGDNAMALMRVLLENRRGSRAGLKR
jgi:hypothetical protein